MPRIGNGLRSEMAAALLAVAAVPAGAQIAPPSSSVLITLGTNAGPRPNPARAEPANVLLSGRETMLIDVGDGASWQLGKAGLALEQVGTIFLSHLHYDHTGGLFAFLGMRYQMLSGAPVTIYGPRGTRRLVDGLLAAMQPESESGLGYADEVRRPPEDFVRVVELTDGGTATIGNVRVTATVNSHYSYAPGSPQAAQYQSLSYRFDMPDRSIAYTGDTGPSANVERLARGADLLVTEIIDPEPIVALFHRVRQGLPEAAYVAMDQHLREQHLTAEQVGLLASRARVGRVVVTHNGLGPDGVPAARAAIQVVFHGRLTIANDLDRF